MGALRMALSLNSGVLPRCSGLERGHNVPRDAVAVEAEPIDQNIGIENMPPGLVISPQSAFLFKDQETVNRLSLHSSSPADIQAFGNLMTAFYEAPLPTEWWKVKAPRPSIPNLQCLPEVKIPQARPEINEEQIRQPSPKPAPVTPKKTPVKKEAPSSPIRSSIVFTIARPPPLPKPVPLYDNKSKD
eukprot:TRINITY_DN41735_c0_g1_i1.p1 TRINITY_DN41735_c0_g1~~TRINITY_DN41735_c0_g1_i1.p1  ORF type:complete len:208 (+),score=28.06 TRINITY_DN41735_c0_g1_i1:66-626(+)